MSDKFVKKQMYECSKCGKIFSSKEEVSDHYDMAHDFTDKYLGAYIMSNDGKYIGKVIREDLARDNMAVIEVISFGPQYKFMISAYCTTFTRYSVTHKELRDDFKIITPEVARTQLKNMFIETGFNAIKGNPTIAKNFKELFETEYREKGDEDGN